MVSALLVAIKFDDQGFNGTAAIVLNQTQPTTRDIFRNAIVSPAFVTAAPDNPTILFLTWTGILRNVPKCGGTVSIVLNSNSEGEPVEMHTIAWILYAVRVPSLPAVVCCAPYVSCCRTASETTTSSDDQVSTFSGFTPVFLANYAQLFTPGGSGTPV